MNKNAGLRPLCCLLVVGGEKLEGKGIANTHECFRSCAARKGFPRGFFREQHGRKTCCTVRPRAQKIEAWSRTALRPFDTAGRGRRTPCYFAHVVETQRTVTRHVFRPAIFQGTREFRAQTSKRPAHRTIVQSQIQAMEQKYKERSTAHRAITSRI